VPNAPATRSSSWSGTVPRMSYAFTMLARSVTSEAYRATAAAGGG
jgi:hypothetical protein